MLYFDRIDVFESININKTSESKNFIICNYRYFLDEVFKFQPDECNGCLDLLMMSMKLNGIAILNIQGVDYCCILRN